MTETRIPDEFEALRAELNASFAKLLASAGPGPKAVLQAQVLLIDARVETALGVKNITDSNLGTIPAALALGSVFGEGMRALLGVAKPDNPDAITAKAINAFMAALFSASRPTDLDMAKLPTSEGLS